jgi:hypothetical protein
MFRTRTLMAFLLVAMVAGLVLTGSGTAWAQQSDVFSVAYYSGGTVSNGGGVSAGTDMQVINTGASGGSLCADIYVFDAHEELKECCRCYVTPDGLLTLTMAQLTSNPANGVYSPNGVIKLISDPGCNETAPSPAPELRAWIVNPNNGTLTESEFEATPLSAQELSNLSFLCGSVGNQTGPGVCGGGNPACTY